MKFKLFLSSLFSGAVIFFAVSGASALVFSPVLFEYEAEPGSPIYGSVHLTNELEKEMTYYAVFQDFYIEDETGSPEFYPPGELASTGSLSAWFQPIDPVTLAPGEKKEVEYMIVVPQDAEPGSHYGAVLFQNTNPEVVGNAVSVNAKTGPVFLVAVAGDIVEEFELLEFRTDPEEKNFWNRRPVDFVIRTKNSGTVHLSPHGMIVINSWWPSGMQVDANPKDLKVLPGSIRRIDTPWEANNVIEGGFFAELVNEFRNFSIGPHEATLALAYGKEGKILSAVETFWVIPWRIILVFVILLLILTGIVKLYNRSVVKHAVKKMKSKEQKIREKQKNK